MDGDAVDLAEQLRADLADADRALHRIQALVWELLNTALADGSGPADAVTFRVPRSILSALAASLGDMSAGAAVMLTETEARDVLAIVTDSRCPFRDAAMARSWNARRRRSVVRLRELLHDEGGAS